MVTVSEELNPLERGSGARRRTNRTGYGGVSLLETHASNLEGCPQRHHPVVRFYSDLDNPKKKPRRGPYCGAPTPMPVPLRIWYSLSRRLMTSNRAVSVPAPFR